MIRGAGQQPAQAIRGGQEVVQVPEPRRLFLASDHHARPQLRRGPTKSAAERIGVGRLPIVDSQDQLAVLIQLDVALQLMTSTPQRNEPVILHGDASPTHPM
ncbi:MAG: hypothetical protein ACRDRT_09685, partial [Pseudonocardiaceae bacterium]